MKPSDKFTTKIVIIAIFLLINLALPFSVVAEDNGSQASASRFSFGLSASVSPFLSGNAGKGDNAPDYDDLFKSGHGIALETEYKLCDHAALIGGIGYEKFSGRKSQGFKFDDLEIVPIYIGCRLQPLPTSPVNPFFRFCLGSAHISAVDLKWNSIRATYWDSSWVFFGSAGTGIDYQVSNWRFSIGVDLRYVGAPENNLKAADADSCWMIPINLGISYTF